MSNFLTKVEFKSKDITMNRVVFNVIKIFETKTYLDRTIRRVDMESTVSTFTGETNSNKDDLIKLIEQRNIKIIDSSCRQHDGIFIYFKPIRNNEYKISFEIKREVSK